MTSSFVMPQGWQMV